MAARVGVDKTVKRRPSSGMAIIPGYQTLEPIGRGSFGTVYKVQRESDGKILVCKSMSYGGMSEREKQLIVSEVNILRELRHPNIVRYYDRVIDKQNTKIHIVMEYCGGGDLGKQIKRRKRSRQYFEEVRIWKLFSQLCLAFQKCHSNTEPSETGGSPKSSRPILHRDVKPGNIFIDSKGNAKLGDFGLAKELNCESRFAYTNVGTPYYMSPEMVNEHKYNEKVDIWSIGCLIYEMAALRPPFEAKNVVALGKKINAGVFDRIPSCYSDKLQQTIASMLQINPARRPSVFQLLSLPMVVRCLNEAKLAGKEVEFNSKLQVAFQQVKSREEEVRKREDAVAVKERKLDAREKELMRRFAELRELERSLNSRSPSSSTSSPTSTSILKPYSTPPVSTGSNQTSSSGGRGTNPALPTRTRISAPTFESLRINPAADSADRESKRFESIGPIGESNDQSADTGSHSASSSDGSTRSSPRDLHRLVEMQSERIRRSITSSRTSPHISVSIRRTSSSPTSHVSPPTSRRSDSPESELRERYISIGERRKSTPTSGLSPQGLRKEDDKYSRRVSLPSKTKYEPDRRYLQRGLSNNTTHSPTSGVRVGEKVATKQGHSYMVGRSSPSTLAGGTTLARLRLEREAASIKYGTRAALTRR